MRPTRMALLRDWLLTSLLVWLSSLSLHGRAQSLPVPAPPQESIPAFKTVDSMEARVQGCVTCHGQSGQGIGNGYYPRIAGKPAGYLYNQLVAFRDAPGVIRR